MKEKEIFETPEIEVMELSKQDIIVTSGGGGGGIVLPDDDF